MPSNKTDRINPWNHRKNVDTLISESNSIDGNLKEQENLLSPPPKTQDSSLARNIPDLHLSPSTMMILWASKNISLGYTEIFPKKKSTPIEYAQTQAEIAPFTILSHPERLQHITIEKRNVAVDIGLRIRNTYASVRGRTISFEIVDDVTCTEAEEEKKNSNDWERISNKTEEQELLNADGHANIYQKLIEHTLALTSGRKKWLNFIRTLPHPVLNEGIMGALTSILNSFYALLSVHIEGSLKFISAALTQPLRYWRLGKLTEPEKSYSYNTVTRTIRALSSLLFEKMEADPYFVKGLKWLARGAYKIVALALYTISLPFSLLGNIVSYVHGIVDSVFTLLALPFRSNIASQDKKDVAWVAFKVIAKNLIALIPTAITIALLFTPAAPAVAGLLIAGKLGAVAAITAVCASAYTLLSLRISGFFSNVSNEYIRKIDNNKVTEQVKDRENFNQHFFHTPSTPPIPSDNDEVAGLLIPNKLGMVATITAACASAYTFLSLRISRFFSNVSNDHVPQIEDSSLVHTPSIPSTPSDKDEEVTENPLLQQTTSNIQAILASRGSVSTTDSSSGNYTSQTVTPVPTESSNTSSDENTSDHEQSEPDYTITISAPSVTTCKPTLFSTPTPQAPLAKRTVDFDLIIKRKEEILAARKLNARNGLNSDSASESTSPSPK